MLSYTVVFGAVDDCFGGQKIKTKKEDQDISAKKIISVISFASLLLFMFVLAMHVVEDNATDEIFKRADMPHPLKAEEWYRHDAEKIPLDDGSIIVRGCIEKMAIGVPQNESEPFGFMIKMRAPGTESEFPYLIKGNLSGDGMSDIQIPKNESAPVAMIFEQEESGSYTLKSSRAIYEEYPEASDISDAIKIYRRVRGLLNESVSGNKEIWIAGSETQRESLASEIQPE